MKTIRIADTILERVERVPTSPDKDISIITKFIAYYRSDIVQKWVDFFVLRKKVSCTDITTKNFEKWKK